MLPRGYGRGSRGCRVSIVSSIMRDFDPILYFDVLITGSLDQESMYMEFDFIQCL